MIKQYFKLAWRNLISRRSSGLINITGLALGMTAAVFILIWVQNELSFDNYHPHGDRTYLVSLQRRHEDVRFGGTPYPLAGAIRKQVTGVEKVSQLVNTNDYNTPVIQIGEKYFKEKGVAYVDEEWFDMLHYDFTEGNAPAADGQATQVVLTETLARKYFGKQQAIGQRLTIDSADYNIAGVIKDNPANSRFQFSILLPLKVYERKHAGDINSWVNFGAETFVRSTVQANPELLERQLNRILGGNNQILTLLSAQSKPDTLVSAFTALPDIHFSPKFSHYGSSGDKKIVWIFSILGLLILTTACINYVNLATAEASKRSREVSIKKIVGAGRRGLFIQFVVESLLTSFIALVIAFVLAKILLPAFNQFTEKNFRLPVFSPNLWQVLLTTLLITVVLTGIYPALLLSSFRPLQVLKGINVLKTKDGTLRKGLVTTQFTIAIALAIGTMVILRQMSFIQHADEGYNRSQIMFVAMPKTNPMVLVKQNWQGILAIKSELEKQTVIEHVTVSSSPMQNIAFSMSGIADWEGRKPDQSPNFSLLAADPDFIDIFKLKLIEGRWFSAENATDKHNYVVTETTGSELQLKKPYVGQYFAVMGDTGRIIGVVKDFHFQSMHNKIGPLVFLGGDDMKKTFFIETRPGKAGAAIAAVEGIWKKFFPQTPFQYQFMDENFDQLYKSDRKTASLITCFAAIAIFISCLGLFGLVAFAAERRKKEVGIRKTLGASVAHIALLLSKDFAWMVAIAFVVASPLAWWAMNKWLQSFAYRINISWWMFAEAGILALSLALLTVSVKAVRAATANPVKALRAE